MKNGLIYLITTTAQSVLLNGIIPLETIVRRRNCACQKNGNGVLLAKPGYYKITGSVTFTAPAAGVVTIEAQKNGVEIPGITASTTITTATTENRTLNINGIIRVGCCEGEPTITLVNTGVAITISNVSLDVEFLG